MVQTVHLIDVIAANGVPFRCVATFRDRTGEWLAEFYDRRYGFTKHGQFTGGRYYAATLLADTRVRGGLDLNGGTTWNLDATTFDIVLRWLHNVTNTVPIHTP